METDFEIKTEGEHAKHTKFSVRAGEFEGPLDLLLDLVEKRKLHISTVSLSQVADEFIEHTKSFEDFPIADSTDFILIASTLLLIKSKSLLPNLNLTPEETENIEDLEQRLQNYKKYKEVANSLKNIFGNFLYFARERKHSRVVFRPTGEVTAENIKLALLSALQSLPKKEILPKISVAKIISLEEMISRLSENIEKNLRMNFSGFSGRLNINTKEARAEKINIIVSFLAMLELVKRGALRVRQENNFEEIEMEMGEVAVPKY